MNQLSNINLKYYTKNMCAQHYKQPVNARKWFLCPCFNGRSTPPQLCPLHPQSGGEVSGRGPASCGITQTVGAEVSKLSHAWILRYKTCLYALVEDFMVAGGMWRKMIASRHRRGREWEGRRTPSKSGEWQGREADVGLHGSFGI